ncbi:alpha/beta fold hydrolase [Falsihalocynthiibacter sp. S25ZX9]|uniref:alpha/beta fold hydrolase n=1 Tax=Falsihalocynthiibacter sp. S25ZX9 TaxID=3240870 RepID=UPI003510553E
MANLSTPPRSTLHSEFGNPDGSPVVLIHGLGMERSVWLDAINALNSRQDCRIITYDLSGHGASDAPSGRGSMGALIRYAEQLMEGLMLRDAVVVGVGLGGMIAQGLAVKRLDLVRGLVLLNSAAKLGTKAHWDAQIVLLKHGGIPKISQSLWEGWLSKQARTTTTYAPWRHMLDSTSLAGYIAGVEALSGTDFYTPISGLSLPTLGISAYNDLLFPPDLMRETVDIIKGSEFQIMPRAGHLAMVEAPEDFATRLDTFLTRIGHRVTVLN